MSYPVLCVFNLKEASRDDFLYAYADLAKLGMKRVIKSDGGSTVTLPPATVMGTFNGKNVNDVLGAVGHQVADIFKARGYRSEFAVFVATTWAWGNGAT